jgi:hypothetical protein
MRLKREQFGETTPLFASDRGAPNARAWRQLAVLVQCAMAFVSSAFPLTLPILQLVQPPNHSSAMQLKNTQISMMLKREQFGETTPLFASD